MEAMEVSLDLLADMLGPFIEDLLVLGDIQGMQHRDFLGNPEIEYEYIDWQVVLLKLTTEVIQRTGGHGHSRGRESDTSAQV